MASTIARNAAEMVKPLRLAAGTPRSRPRRPAAARRAQAAASRPRRTAATPATIGARRAARLCPTTSARSARVTAPVIGCSGPGPLARLSVERPLARSRRSGYAVVTLPGHRLPPVPPQDPAVRAAAHLLHAELDRRLRRPRGPRGARLPRDEGPAGDLGAVHRGASSCPRSRRPPLTARLDQLEPAPRPARAVLRRGRVLRARWRCWRRRSRCRWCSCSRCVDGVLMLTARGLSRGAVNAVLQPAGRAAGGQRAAQHRLRRLEHRRRRAGRRCSSTSFGVGTALAVDAASFARDRRADGDVPRTCPGQHEEREPFLDAAALRPALRAHATASPGSCSAARRSRSCSSR